MSVEPGSVHKAYRTVGRGMKVTSNGEHICGNEFVRGAPQNLDCPGFHTAWGLGLQRDSGENRNSLKKNLNVMIEVEQGRHVVTLKDLTWGGGHPMPYTNDVFY